MFRETASQKRIVLWNAAGSAVYALSSFLMLLIVVRVCGEAEGGAFSVGYAIAQLMLTVGIFEATTYFATDAGNRFTHEQYLGFKIVTCLAMVLVSIVYIQTFGLDAHKAAIAYALCGYRLLEALSQYWYGAFQKENRLDLGGFSAVWRSAIAISLFAVVLTLTKDIVWAAIAGTVGEVVWLCSYDIPRLRRIRPIGRPDFSPRALGQLLWACLPMFLGSFMSIYLTNIGKYAIEAVGTDAMQTAFNILFMPAFVINLFLIFFMRPSLTKLADLWLNRNARPFLRILVKLLGIAVVITACVEAACALLGIPVLQLFYGVDLGGLTGALLVVMLGGGLLSASNVFYNALVVIRDQHFVLVGYAAAIIVASLIAKPLVAQLGIMGACVSYTISCAVLFGCFATIFALCALRQTRKWKNAEDEGSSR